MDVISLTSQLINDHEKLTKILTKLGADKIKYNASKNYITSTRPDAEADNPLGMITYLDNLVVHMNTRSFNGNIYTLVMEVKDVSFPQSLELIAGWLHIKTTNTVVTPPFGGFYKSISRQQNTPELSMKTYSESDLPDPTGFSYMFLKDGVDLQQQKRFGIRYDHESDCVVIPIYGFDGKLVGAKARNNDPNCDKHNRFWAFLEYPKTMTLFGYINNYADIIDKSTVVIVESEKGVAQAASFGFNYCVAIGGHSISAVQCKYIKALNAKRIILAFDEGITEDEMIYEAKKLMIDNQIIKNKVGYIFDKENKYLEPGSKSSPTDHGGKIFKKIIKECVKWLKESKTQD